MTNCAKESQKRLSLNRSLKEKEKEREITRKSSNANREKRQTYRKIDEESKT